VYADNRERRPGCYLVSCHLWTETLADVFITRAFHQRGAASALDLDFSRLDRPRRREKIVFIIIAPVINRRIATTTREPRTTMMRSIYLDFCRVSSRI